MTTGSADAGLVLVVGDANPDLVLRGDVVPRFGQAEQLLDGAELLIGGSAAITAHAFARLGRPVALVAAVGQDHFGTVICDELAAVGVQVEAVARRADVATGLTVVLSRGGDRAILTAPGAIPTLSADEVCVLLPPLLAAGLRHVHVASFFLQPGLGAALPDLLAGIQAAGVTTSLDTNDDPAGTWRGVDLVLPHLDVLLPNRAEVVALAGDDDPRRAAEALAAGGGPLVVVKDGARGAFAVRADGELVETAAPDVVVRDSTGAGDTFNAAFLDAWVSRADLITCLQRAVRAGSLAVTAVGGTAGQPSRADLDPIERTS